MFFNVFSQSLEAVVWLYTASIFIPFKNFAYLFCKRITLSRGSWRLAYKGRYFHTSTFIFLGFFLQIQSLSAPGTE